MNYDSGAHCWNDVAASVVGLAVISPSVNYHEKKNLTNIYFHKKNTITKKQNPKKLLSQKTEINTLNRNICDFLQELADDIKVLMAVYECVTYLAAPEPGLEPVPAQVFVLS